jgi:hypothetical protein
MAVTTTPQERLSTPKIVIGQKIIRGKWAVIVKVGLAIDARLSMSLIDWTATVIGVSGRARTRLPAP